MAELISRDLPVYIPDAGYEYLGSTLSEVDRSLYNHIAKRNHTVVPML